MRMSRNLEAQKATMGSAQFKETSHDSALLSNSSITLVPSDTTARPFEQRLDSRILQDPSSKDS
jgi:hypothetical protein